MNSVSYSAWPCFTLNILKHKYLCETTYTFLCGFVALLCFLCCSCEQLAADPVCLCTGYLLYEPPVPVLQTGPAGQLLLEPTLQHQHVCQGASTSSSAWWLPLRSWETSLLLHFPHGVAYTNVMWHFLWNYLLMEGSGGTATRPRKGNLVTWSKTMTFPLRAAVTRHILWTLWPRSSTGFPFSTEQHIIVLWEELLHTHTHRRLCAWEVIRNQHGSGSRGLRDCQFGWIFLVISWEWQCCWKSLRMRPEGLF